MTDLREILNAKILLVDDDEDSVQLLRTLLEHEGYTSVLATTDPREASALHARERFDLVVLDLQMPGMSGFEVIEALKAADTAYVPVLAVTGEPGHKLHALRAGAKDFVSKPFDWDELLARVHNLLEVKVLLDEACGQAKMLASMALQDPLTGLANRRLLLERVSMAVTHARRNRSRTAVVYLDLDGFKAVNDSHGHGAGDRLLQIVAERLHASVREEDTVARVGGDEFVVALWDLASVADGSKVVAKLIEAVAQPYAIGDLSVTVTTSAGLAVYPVHAGDAETLISRADDALYDAKQAGKNVHRVADAESARAASQRRRARASHASGTTEVPADGRRPEDEAQARRGPLNRLVLSELIRNEA